MERTTTSPEFSPTRMCKWHAGRSAHVLGVPLHRLLHPQRGVARPHRVILVGERRAEERHDAVAHYLVDSALVAMDRLHHPLEHGVEELARLLGIAVGEQLHRALEVGEEHRHLLALAFEGGLRGEDLLGEMLGGVGLRGVELRCRGGAAVAPAGAHTRDRTSPWATADRPHPVHARASGAAHSSQNFAPASFSC